MPEFSQPKKRSLFWPILILIFIVIAFILVVVLLAVALSDGDGIHFSSRPVRVVKIEGPIMDSLDTLKELDEIEHDDSIQAVVLRIDSPGGAVGPSQEIFSQVLRLRRSKKVVVSMGTVAASGGYYIACAGDKIVASPGTITGSIGVIIQGLNLEGALEKLSVSDRTIKSGKYKDAGNPFRRMEDFEREYLQAISDNMYMQFVGAVAEQRKIALDKATELAQGRIYTGQMAKAEGLVDELGNLYDAIALAKKIAGLPEKAGVEWPRKPSFFDTLAAESESQSLLHWLKNRIQLSALPLALMSPPLLK